jgi:uncharacterized membrane protein
MTRKRVWIVLAAATAALILLEGILLDAKPFPGFHAAVGFVSCVVVIAVSKALGRLGLQQPEDPRED